MGMYDSFIDADGNEWQTKAFGLDLAVWRVGDRAPGGEVADYQVEIYDFRRDEVWMESLATIRGGIVTGVRDKRDTALPLMDSWGEWHPVMPVSSEAAHG